MKKGATILKAHLCVCCAHLASSLAVSMVVAAFCQLKRNMRACAQQPSSQAAKFQAMSMSRYTGPKVDKASHTQSRELCVGQSRNTIFDIFMSMQRIYQVGRRLRRRRLEFVLFVIILFSDPVHQKGTPGNSKVLASLL